MPPSVCGSRALPTLQPRCVPPATAKHTVPFPKNPGVPNVALHAIQRGRTSHLLTGATGSWALSERHVPRTIAIEISAVKTPQAAARLPGRRPAIFSAEDQWDQANRRLVAAALPRSMVIS